MRRLAPWLLAVLVLVAALLALVGLGFIAFGQGLGSALVVVLVGYSIFLILFDHPANRRRSN